MPWSGAWDDLPAAHGAALAFDLLTLLGLVLLGRRLRPGREGRELGVALGFAWAAYPYALFALQTNSNDSLRGAVHGARDAGADARPARRAVGARRAVRRSAWPPRRSSRRWRWRRCSRRRGAGRAPRARAGRSFARRRSAAVARRPRSPRSCPTAACARSTTARRLPGLAALAVQHLGPGRVARAGCRPRSRRPRSLLALAVAFVPAAQDPVQVAALAAAVLIAVQLGVTHWFYLYVVWFAPLALVALMAPVARPGPGARPSAAVAARRARAGRRRETARAAPAGGGVLLVTLRPAALQRAPSEHRPAGVRRLRGPDPRRGPALPRLRRSSTRRWPRRCWRSAGSRAPASARTELAFAALTFAAGARGGAARRRASPPAPAGIGAAALLGGASRCCSAGALVRTHFDLAPVALTLAALLLLCVGAAAGRRSPCSGSGRSRRASRWWWPRWRSPGWSRAASAARPLEGAAVLVADAGG